MTVDFYATGCQQPDITDEFFGLCDDENGSPAYVDTADKSKWIAKVDNLGKISLTFTAIDNCIEILREDGHMDNRCDGMLTYPDNIIFVELKNKITGGWIKHGLDQLETTIQNYRVHHNIETIRHKRAFLANRRRRHFHVMEQELKRRFFDTYKVRISIDGRIPIK